MLKPKILLLFAAVSSIFALGLVLIFNTTSAEVLDHSLHRSTHQALLKQMMYAISGGILAFGIWRAGYRNILKYSPVLLGFFTFLLILRV